MTLQNCTIDELKNLLANGADVNELDSHWVSPLEHYASKGEHDHVVCLLEHGAKADHRTKLLFGNAGWVDIIEMAHYTNADNVLALSSASLHGVANVAEYVLSKGIMPNDQAINFACSADKVVFFKYGVTPSFNMIKAACKYSSINVLELLYTKTPDLFLHDQDGYPMDHAIRNRAYKASEWLKSKGLTKITE